MCERAREKNKGGGGGGPGGDKSRRDGSRSAGLDYRDNVNEGPANIDSSLGVLTVKRKWMITISSPPLPRGLN